MSKMRRSFPKGKAPKERQFYTAMKREVHKISRRFNLELELESALFSRKRSNCGAVVYLPVFKLYGKFFPSKPRPEIVLTHAEAGCPVRFADIPENQRYLRTPVQVEALERFFHQHSSERSVDPEPRSL